MRFQEWCSPANRPSGGSKLFSVSISSQAEQEAQYLAFLGRAAESGVGYASHTAIVVVVVVVVIVVIMDRLSQHQIAMLKVPPAVNQIL